MMEASPRSDGPVVLLEKAADQLAALLTDQRPVAGQSPVKVSANGAHVCPEHGCRRQFNRKYTLVEHMKTHTGEKPHVCPVRTCKKRFSTSGNLSRHKRLHGVIEPLECPVDGCICTFASDNKLEKHMKYHLGSPVHVCTIGTCGKTFSTTGNLNRHVKQHHPHAAHRPLPPPPPRLKRVLTSIPRPPPLTAQQPRYLEPVHIGYAMPPPPSLALGAPPMQSSTTIMIPPLAPPQFSNSWMDVPVPSPTLQSVQVHTPTAFTSRSEVLSSVFDDMDYSSTVSKPMAPQMSMQMLPQQNQHPNLQQQQQQQQQSMAHGGRINLFDDMVTYHVSNIQF